jgi:hypothetical protein
MKQIILVLILLLLFFPSVQAEGLSCKVVSVHDGDTFT